MSWNTAPFLPPSCNAVASAAAASTPSGRPAWRTAVFDGELAQAAEQAEAVIAANLGRSK